MTELKWSDRDKVVDFGIAQKLVGELSACEHDWAIYEETRRYAIRIADEDDRRGGYITLEDLFDCMEQAFIWEDERVVYKLDLLKTIEGVVWVISIDTAESLANAAGACKHDEQIFDALKEVANNKALKLNTIDEICGIGEDVIFYDTCLLIMEEAFNCGFAQNDIFDWLESREEATA